jgi:hypothetical protein
MASATTSPRAAIVEPMGARRGATVTGGSTRRRGHRGALSNGRGVLASYVDAEGHGREVIVRRGAEGSLLVIDCDQRSGADVRVVGHLASDEPPGNAALTCSLYLEQLTREECRCRPLQAEDLSSVPFADVPQLARAESTDAREPRDRAGATYRLEALDSGMSIPELRWRRHASSAPGRPRTVSLREAVAALESYEPPCTLTGEALAGARRDGGVSVAVLRVELERVRESPIVLNRRLREVALEVIERQGLTLSEVAIRCGRIKRDACGKQCGETSWLARRLGILPEGGKPVPTPWIHIDVLALIARRGLGVSPLEVELH